MNRKKWMMAIGFFLLFGGSIFLYKGDIVLLESSMFSDIWDDVLGKKYSEGVTKITDSTVLKKTERQGENFSSHHQKLKDRFVRKGYYHESENTMYKDEMGFMPRSIQHSEEHRDKLKQALETSFEIEALLKKVLEKTCTICYKQAPGNPGQSQCLKAC